jgi:4-hydroxythreonine-4-phosphate dehydrogenase
VKDFSINLPRIALLKTGEAEADNIVAGAVQEAVADGIVCVEISQPDNSEQNSLERFDAILTINRAQMRDLLRGNEICYVAALPAVVTASAQGVNYEDAGKNRTSEEAFRNALYAAIEIYRCRQIHKEITAHPLHVKKKR